MYMIKTDKLNNYIHYVDKLVQFVLKYLSEAYQIIIVDQ